MNSSRSSLQRHTAVLDALRADGYGWVQAQAFREWLSPAALQHWPTFAASWNDLGLDTYMADGKRYRRRRFAAFAVSSQEIVRKPHQPHYQSRDYNPVNGGIERWFEPLTDVIAVHPLLMSIMRLCCTLFDDLTPVDLRPDHWHVELHQFRIEARANEHGQPTPEGAHRDGVDWVLVLLIARENVIEGVTTIYDSRKQPIGEFTLIEPFDAALVDDARVYHGVTPIEPLDAVRPGYRDVLVITFRRP
jgi:hypothetical protein